MVKTLKIFSRTTGPIALKLDLDLSCAKVKFGFFDGKDEKVHFFVAIMLFNKIMHQNLFPMEF